MKKYTAKGLKKVLDKHKKWVQSEDEGQRADLQRANLRDAYLQGANLKYADLQNANLRGANLQDAYLRGANLQGANLKYADLQNANLRGTNLRGAYLQNADLRGAKEIPSFIQNYFKKDLLYVLEHCPKQDVEQLRIRVIEGKIQGTQYEGECACLIGSLYQIEGLEDETEFTKSHIPYYECGLHNPSEQLFWQIRENDKPENSIFSRWALDVIDQVLGLSAKEGESDE